MADNDHSLVFDSNGRTVTHAEPDPEGCTFDAYVDRDWTVSIPGTWVFTFHEGGPSQPEGYWLGTYLG